MKNYIEYILSDGYKKLWQQVDNIYIRRQLLVDAGLSLTLEYIDLIKSSNVIQRQMIDEKRRNYKCHQ
jgi:hypothetical protein